MQPAAPAPTTMKSYVSRGTARKRERRAERGERSVWTVQCVLVERLTIGVVRQIDHIAKAKTL